MKIIRMILCGSFFSLALSLQAFADFSDCARYVGNYKWVSTNGMSALNVSMDAAHLILAYGDQSDPHSSYTAAFIADGLTHDGTDGNTGKSYVATCTAESVTIVRNGLFARPLTSKFTLTGSVLTEVGTIDGSPSQEMGRYQSTDLPSGLFYTTTGSCATGDLRFSAIEFTGQRTDTGSRVDVFIYLNPTGSASILFANMDTGLLIQSAATTTWSRIDSNNIKIQQLGNLSFVMDPQNPSHFEIISVVVLDNTFLPVLQKSTANQGFMAIPGVTKWNDRGQTSSDVCGS